MEDKKLYDCTFEELMITLKSKLDIKHFDSISIFIGHAIDSSMVGKFFIEEDIGGYLLDKKIKQFTMSINYEIRLNQQAYCLTVVLY